MLSSSHEPCVSRGSVDYLDGIHVSGRVLVPQLTRQLRVLGIGTVTQQRLDEGTIRVRTIGSRACRSGRRRPDRTANAASYSPVPRGRPSRDRPRWLASPSPARVASCWRDPGNRLPIQGSGIISIHQSPERPWVDVPPRDCRRCWSKWGVR